MKKFYLSLLMTFFLSVHSRAELVAGDIAIVGWNSDDNTLHTTGFTDDNIDFIALTFIPAGTVIYFTDLGWTGTGFQSNQFGSCAANTGAANDGIVRWTATASLLPGTQVVLNVRFGLTASTGTLEGVLASPAGGTGGPAGTSMSYVSLATSIDQIIAFTGSVASPTLIAAVNYGGSWSGAVTTCQFTSVFSVNPGAAVGNFQFLFSSTNNNARYNGPLTGDAATLRSNILVASNWTSANSALAFPIAGVIFLPVHLISFEATQTEQGNELLWRVENEDDFSHYMVEASSDGVSFADIGKVAATGQATYSFLAPLKNGKTFYRLRLVDLDGSFDYGKTIVVESGSALSKVSVYPNPVRNVLKITAPGPVLRVVLMDRSGRMLKSWTPGTVVTETDVSNLPAGIYLLQVKTVAAETTQQIHKL